MGGRGGSGGGDGGGGGGDVYEMVIRADRRRNGGRMPSQAGDEPAPTWRCVISLKPNWYMPINPRHL